MGRAGVTILDVQKAVLQLQSHGRNPTVDSIREILGTGSKSTIAHHLKTWKTRHTDAQGKLPHDLQTLVTGLWEHLNRQAEQRIVEIEDTRSGEIEELKQALSQAQQENSKLKAKIHHAEETVVNERHEKITLEKQLHHAQHEYAKIQERYTASIEQLENSKTENMRLHQLAKNIQTNLEHYQNSMQQLRTEQTLTIENQQVKFQQEIVLLQQELTLKQAQIQEINYQLNAKKLEIQQVQDQYNFLQIKNNELERSHQSCVHELILLKERYEQQSKTLLTFEHELSSFRNLQTQMAVLTDNLNQSQQNLSQAKDKIEILQNEKIFLTQEKSELLGYVKKLDGAKEKNGKCYS
jgi:chromosome segregation ATPase